MGDMLERRFIMGPFTNYIELSRLIMHITYSCILTCFANTKKVMGELDAISTVS